MTKELAKIQSAFRDAFQRVGKRKLPEVLDRVFSGDDELGLTAEQNAILETLSEEQKEAVVVLVKNIVSGVTACVCDTINSGTEIGVNIVFE